MAGHLNSMFMLHYYSPSKLTTVISISKSLQCIVGSECQDGVEEVSRQQKMYVDDLVAP
jgi:hypothetical protein